MKETVLVVDDQAIIRDPIAATLASAGYQVLRASDGKRAFEMLRIQSVNLILLDVNMPVMGGLEFLRLLRSDKSTVEIPVIMLTGAEDRHDILQAAKLGVRGYILKSQFSLKDLLSRVKQHFASLTLETATVRSGKKTEDSFPGISTSAPAGHSSLKGTSSPRPSILSSASEIPSLMNREQCIERAQKALSGRTLSGVVAEVISLATSPRGDASDLTAMIARDPLLAARVLQVANSSAYASRRGVVSTLSEAVRNIGSAAVRNIASALGVFNAIPESDSDGLNLLRCWQHAFAVATLCNQLAKKEDSGMAYLIGLCRDLGEIIFHSQFAAEYQQVLEFEQSTGRPRDEVEKAMLGMSHGELLQTIVQCLKLPDAISIPILEYHKIGPGAQGGSAMTRRLRLADLYANGMLLASSTQSPIRPITCAEANAVTGSDNPPALDRASIRGEIVALTATLSRFSEKQQAELMAAPFPRQPIRVWLARDRSLSSLDPMEAVLELLAEVTARETLPNESEAANHQAIIVTTTSTSTSAFTVSELKTVVSRRNGNPLSILWLAGKIDGELNDGDNCRWPIPLAKLAEFVAAGRLA